MTIDPDRLTSVIWRACLLLVFVWVLSTLLAGFVGYELGYDEGFRFAAGLSWG